MKYASYGDMVIHNEDGSDMTLMQGVCWTWDNLQPMDDDQYTFFLMERS